MRIVKPGAIIFIPFAVRCILACVIELNNDEVYYWTYAQRLQWNYFDHPSGIAVLLKMFTVNLLFQHEFFLRLGPIVCGAVSTWLMYRIGKKIKNEFAGLVAAVLFAASPYCSIIAGLLVIPDAPQLVCWLASVLLMLSVINPRTRRRKINMRLLLLGFTIGCCMLCKVHGIFLWAGFLLYIVSFQRSLLKNPYLLYAFIVSAFLFSPVIGWNLTNNFVSYAYHSGRVSFFSGIHPDIFFRELFGEVLYNNPFIFVLIVIAFIAMIKKQTFLSAQFQRLLLLLSLPMITLVLFMAVFRDTLPHWTGPAYATLIPLAAAWLVPAQASMQQWIFPAAAKRALAFILIVLVPVIVLIKWLPYNFGKSDPDHLGEGDPSLDMNGFKKFGVQFDSLYKRDIAEGRMKKAAFILSDGWFPAAHLDYYVAQPAKLNLIAIGKLNDIHHYAWLNNYRPGMEKGADAYYISVSNYFRPPAESLVEIFEKCLPPVSITQYRSGIAVRHFFIYRLHYCKNSLPADGIMAD